MAIKKINISVDADLYVRFQADCKSNQKVYSWVINELIKNHLNGGDKLIPPETRKKLRDASIRRNITPSKLLEELINGLNQNEALKEQGNS